MKTYMPVMVLALLLALPELAFARGSRGGSPFFIIAIPLACVIGWLMLQVKGETWRMLGGFVIAASVILAVIGFVSSFL